MTKRGGHLWAVDGIEEGMARIEEDGDRMIAVPVYLIPTGIREGQLLRVTSTTGEDDGTLLVTVVIDEKATADAFAKSKATTAKAMSASKKHDPGGDVAL